MSKGFYYYGSSCLKEFVYTDWQERFCELKWTSMNTIKLKYSMTIKNDKGVIHSVVKYWKQDENPMAYKVRLKRIDTDETGESFYSSDLVSLIEKNIYSIVWFYDLLSPILPLS